MQNVSKQQQAKWLVIYHIIVAILAIISSVLAILMMVDFKVGVTGKIIFQGLLAFFAIDYVVRLIFTKNRKWFLINNAFDLLGILPMHPAFSLFRLARILRMVRTHHIFWKLGISGKWTRDLHRFTYDTGFIYLFTISVVIICVSAWLFSIVEHQTLSQSLWWALTTATTVGYGDDSPRTAWGKLIASVLMIGGVGFIGLLTSTITDFFTDRTGQEDAQQQQNEALTKQIEQLTREVSLLSKKVDKMHK
ncbi:two pore domain potassium channel family protein [Lactobacillus sp. LC28-10]|uniref:Two pore domain potassium channel family protein n=1 Tax=Secundilactobacillus angelensis TaxID=2722706 RepID=A0ABX1L1N8_9LACO|nr:potassium channel family protein [Secundilactobacillus angelensis]MCH5463019.1 potassium channel family protein [Secundilactobacillus angelensis]NLR19350.1 two pore domain potassium channel family protein [Secundilactobacillus angelensis]